MALDLPRAINFVNPQPKLADHTTTSILESVGPGGFGQKAKFGVHPSVPQLNIYWNCVLLLPLP